MILAVLTIPEDAIAGALGVTITGLISLYVYSARTRERLVRLEEWVRLHNRIELKEGDE